MDVNFEKYQAIKDQSFFIKLGKVVNVVGLSIESAGPDAKLGDLCLIHPNVGNLPPAMAEVVGFRDRKTLLMPYGVTTGIGPSSNVR